MRITIHRKLPVNYDARDRAFFEREFSKEIEPPSTLLLHQATITSQGIVYEKLRLVKSSLVPEIPNRLTVLHLIAQVLKKKKLKWTGSQTPVVVFDYWYTGYFHWMTEALPRLLYQQKLGKDFVPVIPRDNSAPFIEKTLEPFHLEACAWIAPTEYLRAREVLLVKHTAPTGNFNEDLVRELRTLFRSHFVNTGTTQTVDRIYVSRGRTGRRRVINENEVSALLRSYGFVTLYFEDYTFEKQVQLASQTTMMISIHGAGLTNMLFMKEKTSVLEFRPKNDYTNLCYFALASALDLNYYYQFGEPEQDRGDINDDLFIDLIKLKENVERMLSPS
jgi:capsular polysaccharide biosynthesis protein